MSPAGDVQFYSIQVYLRLFHAMRHCLKILQDLTSPATLLLRDAMPKRGLCCRPVSVRLSCLWIVSIWLKILPNFLFGPVGPAI